MKSILEYTKTFHEVHTSQDGGEKWIKSGTFNETPEGLKQAQASARKLLETIRDVRVAQVTRHVRVLEQLGNNAIATRQQVEALCNRGRMVLNQLPGIRVNESFAIDMTTLQPTPTQVMVSVHVESVLGKRPKSGTQDQQDLIKQRQHSWDVEAGALIWDTMKRAQKLLQTAGVKHKLSGDHIVLLH